MTPFGYDPERDDVIRLMCHEGVTTIAVTGSQYICTPPPVDSDEDWVLLFSGTPFYIPVVRRKMWAILRSRGFSGPETTSYGTGSGTFTSWRKVTPKSNVNIMLTSDPAWFNHHAFATNTCRWLNLLHKPDRITVFRSILYNEKGNDLMAAPRIKFMYRNHRQQVNERDVTVKRIEYLTEPGYGYEPGWFVIGYDHARADERRFKFENIIAGIHGAPPSAPILINFEEGMMSAEEVAGVK